eukprot:Skav204833  [mRNA]  locus=scaffold2524:45922:52067:- [translate_table: standard]
MESFAALAGPVRGKQAQELLEEVAVNVTVAAFENPWHDMHSEIGEVSWSSHASQYLGLTYKFSTVFELWRP